MAQFEILLALIAGFLVAKIFSGRKMGEEGVFKSVRFSVGAYTVHLHHWLLSGAVLVLVVGHVHKIFIGLLVGILIQGLTYGDFYKVVYRGKSPVTHPCPPRARSTIRETHVENQ